MTVADFPEQTSFLANLPSSKLTWQWKFTFSNRKYIFKWWVFHWYVSLPDCNRFGIYVFKEYLQWSVFLRDDFGFARWVDKHVAWDLLVYDDPFAEALDKWNKRKLIYPHSFKKTFEKTDVDKNGIQQKTPEPRKKPSYFPLYWLFNRDPNNGLL